MGQPHPEKLYEELKSLSEERGGILFGVADISAFHDRMLLSEEEISGMTRALSVGIRLSPAVLDGVIDKPTLLYKWHYRQANILLDRIAFDLSQAIIAIGGRALPIPASQMVDWEKQLGHLSHRSVAEHAGLGWRGRNNLLVTRRFGAKIRLVSVLTDLALPHDSPKEDECGSCNRCISLCPAAALGNSYEEYDLDKCFTLLKTFAKAPGIGVNICGVCVKACSERSV